LRIEFHAAIAKHLPLNEIIVSLVVCWHLRSHLSCQSSTQQQQQRASQQQKAAIVAILIKKPSEKLHTQF